MKNGEQIEATVTVINNGNYDGEEVVQLYLHDLVGSVTRPVKELKGFQKVMIRKGEAKKITFTITDKELTFLRGDMTWGTEPGMFEVLVGTNSDAVKKKWFELVK
jgi:beta-glucosidase